MKQYGDTSGTPVPPVALVPKQLRSGLLSVLRCPVTGQDLVQEGASLLTVSSGSLGNASGALAEGDEDKKLGSAGGNAQQLRYPIDEGIPILLPDSAEKIEETL